MNPVPAKDNPLSMACPMAELSLVWKEPRKAYCQNCRKDVHDLRGLSLVQVAEFMRTHKGDCIMFGAAAKPDENRG